jgi:hypothetical protein
MGLYLGLPEVVALAERNPARWQPDIGGDKLNTPGSKQIRDVIGGEPSDTRGRRESVIMPQLCEGQLGHDFKGSGHAG